MNKFNEIISIIIPCYNCEEYIESSIYSIINQTYKNIEIVFIDDGSTDNSLKKATNLLEKYNINYKTICQNNKGVSVARNIGIENISGKYTYFMDADDLIDCNLFEKAIENLEEKNLDFICFGYNKIRKNKKIFSYRDKFSYIESDNGNNYLKSFLTNIIDINMCSFITKSSIIYENKIRFRENCFYGEDTEFIIKLLVNSNKVDMIKDEFFSYRIRESSAMNNFSEKRFTGIDAFEGVKSYLDYKEYDKEIITLIEKRICKEVISICNSYAKFSNKISKEEVFKIKSLLKKYKTHLKSFIPLDNYERYLKLIYIFMNFSTLTYIFLVKAKKNFVKSKEKL